MQEFVCVLLFATGIVLTVRTGGVQRYLPHGFAALFRKETAEGEIGVRAALCTALAATLGTGNIVGVATAVALGGPGALLWLVAAGVLGMATKFSEILLAVKYRKKTPKGVTGGPFYYITEGLGQKFCPLAVLFAVCGMAAGTLGLGTLTQMNGITGAVQTLLDPEKRQILLSFGTHHYTAAAVVSGGIAVLAAATVLIGGIRRIGAVCETLVPMMTVGYIICSVTVIVTHHSALPGVVKDIFVGAAAPKAVLGGAAGVGVRQCAKAGICRGILCNEAGLGSAPIAAAAAQTREPVRQGLIGMVGTLFDTVLLAPMSGLCVLLTDAHRSGESGVGITAVAWQKGLPTPSWLSAALLAVFLCFFAFTTVIGWYYYAERCFLYLSGGRGQNAFCRFYIIMLGFGIFIESDMVWKMTDFFNCFMALPNLIALLLLGGDIRRECDKYFGKIDKRKQKYCSFLTKNTEKT